MNAARQKVTAFLIDMHELAFAPTVIFLSLSPFFLFYLIIKLVITEANAFPR